MSPQTFGYKCSENILEKVNLSILGLDGSDIFFACFIKGICAPLNNQNIILAEKNFPRIRNVLHSDSNPNNKSLPVDILIGAHYYWSIVNNQVIKAKQRPTALDTKVGWILDGPVNNPFLSVYNSVLLSHVDLVYFTTRVSDMSIMSAIRATRVQQKCNTSATKVQHE